MMELIDLVKFNVRPVELKANAHVICVAGSEDTVHIAKSGAVALMVEAGIRLILVTLENRLILSLILTFSVMCRGYGLTSMV